MKKVKNIFDLYIGSKAKAEEEADFARWILNEHDSEAKDKEMEEVWKRTSSRLVSVREAKRKIDSVLFPEQSLIRRYKIALGSVCVVAASLVVALVLTYDIVSSNRIPEYAEINTISGQNTEIELSDGTKVILNSHSKLIFPERFYGDTREVFLTGEALFDVTTDKTKPFIVNVSDYSIEVLGTVFNVADYMDDTKSIISLKQGRVKLNLPDSTPVFLVENQGVIYDKISKTMEMIKVDPFTAMSWSNGVMCFDGSDIYEIIKMAERRYGVRIICSDHPKYANAKITARFDACGEVESLLSVLEKLIPGMEYSKTGSVIYLR